MGRNGAIGALVAAMTVAVGCAHGPDIPGWKRVSTPHFRVYTAMGPHSFEPVVERLEDVHLGLTSSFFAAEIPPMEVWLFDPGEFHDLLGPVGGVFVPGVGAHGVLVVYEGWDAAFIDQTAAHELTHAFAAATWRWVPTWFDEGLATYAESIRIQDGAVLFGSRHVHVDEDALAGRLVPVHELFTAPWSAFHGDWERRHYATAWALVHYVWHGEDKRLRKRFDAYGAALAQQGRRPDGGERAWEAVFPDVPLAQLDERLARHIHDTLARGRDAVVGFRLSRTDRPEPRLDPADMTYVDAVRAKLRRYRRADKI